MKENPASLPGLPIGCIWLIGNFLTIAVLVGRERELSRFPSVLMLTPRGNPMKFNENNAYRTRAKFCSNQSDLNKDEQLKQYWSDLSDSWIALADVIGEKPSVKGEHSPTVFDRAA